MRAQMHNETTIVIFMFQINLPTCCLPAHLLLETAY